MPKINLIRYLLHRLKSHNVSHIHGVPGDFMLKALDHLKPASVSWVGNCNELNAGYAADGYARVRGLGALWTTYGVGELSAINAVAASFSEFVPVLHIVGTPARSLQRGLGGKGRGEVHHSLGFGAKHGMRTFAEMYKNVTCAQGNLMDEKTAAGVIDEVLGRVLRLQRPGYLEVPSDMVHKDVSASGLETLLEVSEKVDEVEEGKCAERLLKRIYTAKCPLLLVDRGYGVELLREEINELVRVSGIPTLAMPSGNGMVEAEHANYYGVHSGPVGRIDTMPFLEQADLVLAFGCMFSDTQTLGWATVPERNKTVMIRRNVAAAAGPMVDGQRVLRKVLDMISPEKIAKTHAATSLLGDYRILPQMTFDPEAPITQTHFYERLNPYLKPNDTILLANATPILGGRDLILSANARVIASGMAFSIGHMLPAAQGVALAKSTGRTILLEGDGSFQVTAQELSTIIHQRLNVTIFILNNSGYAYERLIHGPNETYNDIVPWDYLKAPDLFGRPEGYPIEMYRIRTWREMDEMMAKESFQNGEGLKLVDVVVGRIDVPEKFSGVFEASGRML